MRAKESIRKITIQKTLGYAVNLSAAMVRVFGMSGCPPQSKGHVAVLLAGDLNARVKTASAKGSDIDLQQIAALLVILTEISLDRPGNPEEGEGEGDNDEDSKVVVFSGAVDVDLRDLAGASELISITDIPAGSSSKSTSGTRTATGLPSCEGTNRICRSKTLKQLG